MDRPPRGRRHQRGVHHLRHLPRGRHTHCPNRTTLGIHRRDGALADMLLLPQANLYAVPDNVPDKAAVFVEPLAAVCEIPGAIAVAADSTASSCWAMASWDYWWLRCCASRAAT